MEHNKHEIAVIADEDLGDVSGGVVSADRFTCTICKKTYLTSYMVLYKDITICKNCKKTLESQPVHL